MHPEWVKYHRAIHKLMLVMARDRDYPELLVDLTGKKVAIWTCNTCARMCYGLGGDDSAARLAEKLRADGVDVKGIVSTSAACLETKTIAKREAIQKLDPVVILALTCCVGAECAGRIFGGDVVNPVETFGFGYLTVDGDPVLVTPGPERKLKTVSALTGPYA
jgi:hypothetical protein